MSETDGHKDRTQAIARLYRSGELSGDEWRLQEVFIDMIADLIADKVVARSKLNLGCSVDEFVDQMRGPRSDQ